MKCLVCKQPISETVDLSESVQDGYVHAGHCMQYYRDNEQLNESEQQLEEVQLLN